MLDGMERQMMLWVVEDRVVMDHLSVEGCLRGEESSEVAKMSVGYVQHRSNADQRLWDSLHSMIITVYLNLVI